MSASETISPTAHYTGYVWARNGLSHPELQTLEGRVLYESLRPAMIFNELLGRGTLEAYLLTRHRAIDALLERAIDEGGVTQVIEVAAGLSARGWRFTSRHGDRLVYVEADLQGMAERKRAALERMGALSERHRVVVLDVLSEEGPRSLAALAGELDADRGLAILTEGLLGYLPHDAVEDAWRGFARVLGGFSTGRYISDVHLGAVADAQVQAFRVLLSLFVRGRVHLHFQTPEDVVQALREAGFASAVVLPATDIAGAERNRASGLARILEASTT